MVGHTNEALWQRTVKEITAGTKGGNAGQWSARKAQLAVLVYKKAGGGFTGPKSPNNSLAKWTRQNYQTKSGKPSLLTGERYLPEKAIKSLTSKEYAETSRVKREGMKKGIQFVKQPSKIAEKVKEFTE